MQWLSVLITVMTGLFMIDNIIKISSDLDVIIYDYYVKIDSHVIVYDNEIDNLIAALIKAKAIMASDKSK